MKRTLGALLILSLGVLGYAQEWSLSEAAAPYEGTTITAMFLDRPGYQAAIELIPQFEEQTGINVEWEILPYENTREREVLDFTSGSSELDVILVDVVWIGEFAAAGWLEPLEQYYNDPELANPNLNLDDFFPVLLDSFGTWDGTVYGLPFDNYSGLLFYNQCMLEEAGFDGPPETWTALKDEYGPALTGDGQYAFALQSRRGETQSADSFMRVLWPFGGALINNETFEPVVADENSLQGLTFRQELMEYMPEGIVDYDHAEAVQALAQGNVAMITEWSSFYATLNDPEQSQIVDCLGVAPEPAGSDGRVPALGGFSLGVNTNSSDDEKTASWLFIQWVTSAELAEEYVRAGGVSGRQSAYEGSEILEEFSYIEPMIAGWEATVPYFRPRFPEWPAISEIIAEVGTTMMLGQISVEEGAQQVADQTRAILEQAGYYGDREKIQ